MATDKTTETAPTEVRTDRASTTRVAFQRAKAWARAELLPMFNPMPGWRYRWVRVTQMGESDAKNVSAQMREGWEPVQLADHPEIQLFSNDSDLRGRVIIGGLMLCKIPEEFVSQRNAYFQNITEAQTEAVDNNFMSLSDRRMPLFSNRESTVKFGAGSKL